jgi:catechol 2,3-dioxygenase-like lactoylglutathione lyase family enzyme/ketosteroid isomerase-like protein
MTTFTGVCLITADMPRLMAFYRAVLGIEPSGDEAFASFALPGATLALFGEADIERMAPGSQRGAGRGACTLELEVADVDLELERLVALGAAIVKPPTTQPWGRRSVWFRDPDGNLVNFHARVGAGERRTPKDIVEEYFHRLLNEHDLSVCDALLDPAYRDHDAPPDSPPGPTATKTYVADLLKTYPDLRVNVEDLLAEGDRVAARLRWRGTHIDTGAGFGQIGLVFLRLRDGRIVERWSAYQS